MLYQLRTLCCLMIVVLMRSLMGGSVIASAAEQPSPPKDLLRCGPSSLQFCAAMCGRPLEADEIEEHIEGKSEEHTLAEVDRAAGSLGLRTLAVRWTGTLPPAGATPAIIRIVTSAGKSHFVSLAGCRDGWALIVDLPNAPGWIPEARLREKLQWSGEALHIAASDAALSSVRASAAATSRRRRSAAGLAAVIGAVAVLAVGLRVRRRHSRSPIVQQDGGQLEDNEECDAAKS